MPTKLDQSTTASRKALSLFGMLLFSRTPHSLKQLAEMLCCSRQTVLRLIDEIEQTNTFSLKKWKDGKENWYQAQVPDARPNLTFSQAELTQLLLCRDFMTHILPPEHQSLLLSATDKASCFQHHSQNATPTTPDSLGRGVVKGAIDYTDFEAMLDSIVVARNTFQVLEIEYLARLRTESKTHAFVPVRLLSYHDGLYVRGWTVTDKGTVEIIRPMTLALHRMKQVWPTRRNLTREQVQKQPFPQESHCFGMAQQCEPFTVKVRFYPPATVYVKERIWSQDQHIEQCTDSTLILTFTAQSEFEVVKWILGFGQEAELLAPVHLRERVVEELECALRHHKND